MPIGWEVVLAVLASTGFGVLSAVVPVVNAEAYVVASQVSGTAGPLAVALGTAVGQTVGKVLLFLGVRRGSQFAGVRPRRRLAEPERAVSPTRARLRRAMTRLLLLVGRPRSGLPITFVAAVAGLPPLYAVTLLAGATRMRLAHFTAVVLTGRVLRFLAVAYGVGGFWP